MKVALNPNHSSSKWIKDILMVTQPISNGRAELHLVGAILQSQYEKLPINPFVGKQSNKVSSYAINQVIYHVSIYPSQDTLQDCAENLSMGIHPILLIPIQQKNEAQMLARNKGLDKDITIISIEDFFAITIIELASKGLKDPYIILKEIVQIYNKRLEKVETDLSLQIEVK